MGRDKVEHGEPKLTTIQEVAKSYFQNAMNTLGREGVDNEIIKRIRDVVAIHLGPDMEKFVLSNALTLMAAFVEIRTLLIKRGVPAWVAEMLDEGLNDLFEGARSSIVDKDRMPADAAQRVLKNASEKWTKSFVESDYDKAIQLLSKEDFDYIESFFLSLSAVHQMRFNALKPRLKNIGEIRLFIKRLLRAKKKDPMQKLDNSKLLELVEPFYGIKPYKPTAPSIGSVFTRLKEAAEALFTRADKGISDVVKNPDNALASAAAKVRAVNHRNDASRMEKGRKFQDLKKTRVCDIRSNTKKEKSK